MSRTPITQNPKAFETFSKMARAPGHHLSNHTAALGYLQLSPYEANADQVYEAGGGDELTQLRDNGPRGGRPLTFGELFLQSVRVLYPRHAPEFLTEEGSSRHFDGRPPTPRKRLPEHERAAFQVRHHDMFEQYELAIATVVKADVLVDRADVSPELAAYVTAHAAPDELRHFVWLATPRAKVA